MKKSLLLLTILLVFSSISAAPTRSSIATKETDYIEKPSTITAKSYVQKGLIALWDGIENPPSSRGWIDCIGAANMRWNSVPPISEDHIAFAGNSNQYGITDGSEIVRLMQTEAGVTIELAYVPTGYNGNGGIIGIGDGNNRTLWIWSWASARTYPGWIENITCKGSAKYFGGISNNTYESGTLALRINSEMCEVIHNGVEQVCMFKAGTKIAQDTAFRLAKMGSFGSGKFNCYGLRWYARMLTDKEIMHNYKVDKVRFGL